MRGLSLGGRGGDLVLLALGLMLIWKGITGNTIATPLGNELFPRWMYIGGGIILLTCSAVFFVLRYKGF